MEGEVANTKQLLERIAVACERMAEDPVIEMETAPPVCPHCERINPVIRVEESGGAGLMAEFVIRAKCEHCGNVFYALPIQWHAAVSVPEITQAVQARKEMGGYGSGDNGKQ